MARGSTIAGALVVGIGALALAGINSKPAAYDNTLNAATSVEQTFGNQVTGSSSTSK
jgi:hypothetical protein